MSHPMIFQLRHRLEESLSRPSVRAVGRGETETAERKQLERLRRDVSELSEAVERLERRLGRGLQVAATLVTVVAAVTAASAAFVVGDPAGTVTIATGGLTVVVGIALTSMRAFRPVGIACALLAGGSCLVFSVAWILSEGLDWALLVWATSCGPAALAVGIMDMVKPTRAREAGGCATRRASSSAG